MNGEIFIAWEDGRKGPSNIYFSNGIVKNGSLRFSKNIKITASFVKPDSIFLGLILGSVIVSIIIVGFLRGKNEK